MSKKKFIIFCTYILCSFLSGVEKDLFLYDRVENKTYHKKVESVSFDEYEAQRLSNEERIGRFKKEDLEGKKIIDFGCNAGGMLLASVNCGAQKVLGIDINEESIKEANSKAVKMGLDSSRYEFCIGDLENKAMYHNLPNVDTVFLLSILDSSLFANRYAVLTNVSRKANHVMYYEGHVGQSHVYHLYNLLVWTDFTRYEYLGRSEEGRILIRCSRDMIEHEKLPKGAITTRDSQDVLLCAEEIYVLPDSKQSPCFSSQCRLIQYVR